MLPRPDSSRTRPCMTVQHDVEGSRFVVSLPDGEAQLVYAPFGDDLLDLQHTEVPPSGHGEGVGDALVRAALAYARAHDLNVIATSRWCRGSRRNSAVSSGSTSWSNTPTAT